MVASKRKRPGDHNDNGFYQEISNDDIDISKALSGQRSKQVEESEDDNGLKEFLLESISKRDVKSGTEVIKKVKGKAKPLKGETGGGSFQSMGP